MGDDTRNKTTTTAAMTDAAGTGEGSPLGMRVLLTGGCGFIGSNLAHHVLFDQVEAPVDLLVVLDSMTHGSDEANVTDLLEAASADATHAGCQRAPIIERVIEGARCRSVGRVAVVHGEFGNARLVAQLLSTFAIDHVLHLAGETHVDRSYTDPARCIEVNVLQLVSLLEAVVGRVPVDPSSPSPPPPLKRFLHMSTDEVYGDASQEACDESTPMDPTNPYAASKGASELLIGAYRHSYGLPAVVVRCNNVYGPRQTTDKAIPRFVGRALEGHPLLIHGGGLQTRNWVHARDACRAIWTAAIKGAVGTAYNIGSDDEVSVVDVAVAVRDIVASDMGKGSAAAVAVPIHHVADRPHNDAHYYIDSARIRTELGWTPSVPFEEGLADTVRWYMMRALARARSESTGPKTVATAAAATNDDDQGADQGGAPSHGQRVLVYGHRGWIGAQVLEHLRARTPVPDVVLAKTRPGDDPDTDVEGELDAVCPTHVLSLVGRTHGPGCGTVDYLEGGDPQRLHENVRDNLYAPVMLADACVERGIHMTYLGTGCIYAYEADEAQEDALSPHHGSRHPDATGYTEADAPNFRGSAYSTVKAFTDRLVRRMGSRSAAASVPTLPSSDVRPLPEGPVRATQPGEPAVLNARIRMPVSGRDGPRDFVTKIASYERVVDVPNSVTVLPELLPAMLDLALDHRATGTINLVNPGAISHNEVLAMYKEIVDPAFVTRNFAPGPALDALMARRSNCKLDASALVAACPTRTRASSEAVRACIESMAAASAAAAAAAAVQSESDS